MKKNKTELVFILDKSGSMSGLESDTIGGFNAMLTKQQKQEGEATITTVLFDDRYEILHDRLNLQAVRPISEREYFVEGSTALLDAVGKTIQKIVKVQKNSAEEERAEKVMFVIITDGMENASKEYSYRKIKEMIEQQKERWGWEFIFLGANIDSEQTARELGIDQEKAVNYHADSQGIVTVYAAAAEAVCSLRSNKKLDKEWRSAADQDYQNRKQD